MKGCFLITKQEKSFVKESISAPYCSRNLTASKFPLKDAS